MYGIDDRNRVFYGRLLQDAVAQVENMPRPAAGLIQNFLHSTPDFLAIRKQDTGVQVTLDRKVMSDIAIHEPQAFEVLVGKAKEALAYLKDTTPNAFESAVR